MTWVIADLAGTKNSSNQDFTISSTAIAGSMMVIYQGIRLVQVAVEPVPGEAEYGNSGVNVRVGQPPASGEDLWARWFH